MNLFKKIGVAVVGIAMAIGVGVAVGSKTEVKMAEASPTSTVFAEASFDKDNNQSKVGSYTDSWVNITDGFSWSIANFNNNNNGAGVASSPAWTYIKCGRKDYTSVATITTSSSVTVPVTKVTITIDDVTAANVNSITLYGGTGSTSLGTFTIATGTQTVNIDSEKQSAGQTYKVSFDCKAKKNGTLTLSSVKLYYNAVTLTYNNNGGTGSMTDSNSPYYAGATVTTKTNGFTAPDGKIFNGWNTESEGGGSSYAAGTTFTINDNTVLYAQWVNIPTDPYVLVDDAEGYTGQTPSLSFSFGSFASTLDIVSDNTDVVTVGAINATNPSNASVVLSYVGEGSATLTFKDGSSDVETCEITVTQTSISGLVSSKTVYVSDTLNLATGVSVNVGSLTWSSATESKATVNSSTGVVTGVAEGTSVITATSSVDSRVTATCTVTVKPQPIYQKITSAPADWRGTYLLVYEAGNQAFNGSLDELDSSANYISASVVSSKVTGSAIINAATITIGRYVDGEGDTQYYAKAKSGKYFGNDGTGNGLSSSSSDKYTISVVSNGSGGFTIQGAGGCKFQNYTSTKFRFYGSSQYPVSLYRLTVDEDINSEVSGFATTFLSTMTCSGSGSVTAASGSWDAMSSTYSALSMDAQRELALTDGDKTGVGVAGAIGRYDEIISKHGTSDYPDFMFRVAASKLVLEVNNDFGITVTSISDNSVTLIIVVISLLSVTALGGYFLLRRRKEN